MRLKDIQKTISDLNETDADKQIEFSALRFAHS
jgi:hypothetical protein